MSVIQRRRLRRLLADLRNRGISPREIWLAATADALRKALPPESHILEEFMKRRGEELTPQPSAPWREQDDEWVKYAIDAAVRSMYAFPLEEPSDELDDRVATAVTRQYFKSWPFYLAIGLLTAALSLYGIQVGTLMVDVKQVGAIREHAIEEVNKAKAEIKDKTGEVDTEEKTAIAGIRNKIPQIIHEVGTPESIRQEVVKSVREKSDEAIKPDRDKLLAAYRDGTAKVNDEAQKLVNGLPKEVADLAKNVRETQARQDALETRLTFAKNNTVALTTLLDKMKLFGFTGEQWVPFFLAKSFQYSAILLGISFLISLIALIIALRK